MGDLWLTNKIDEKRTLFLVMASPVCPISVRWSVVSVRLSITKMVEIARSENSLNCVKMIRNI